MTLQTTQLDNRDSLFNRLKQILFSNRLNQASLSKESMMKGMEPSEEERRLFVLVAGNDLVKDEHGGRVKVRATAKVHDDDVGMKVGFEWGSWRLILP